MLTSLAVALPSLPHRRRHSKPRPRERRHVRLERTLRLPEVAFNYTKNDWPAHFKSGAARRADNTPSSNPITDAGATLGRVLFYDTRLSANNTVACASCHPQKNGFADPRRFSKGHGGKETDRHAPSLANVRFYARGKFFWDERAGTLEEQVLKPIQSKVEMGQDLTVRHERAQRRSGLWRPLPEGVRRSRDQPGAHRQGAGPVRAFAGLPPVEV